MEPQNQSGGFGAVLNDGGALGRALARRQGGEPVSPLSQVSPSISTEGQMPSPPTGSAMPQGMAQRQQPMSTGTTAGMPDDEKILIIKALSNRLSSISKAESPQM